MAGTMRPLKVTCHLASPLAGDPPYLDAAIEWALCRRARAILASKNGHRHAGMNEYVPGTIPIPIARRRVSGYPHLLPLCSNPILPASADVHEYVAKRVEVDVADVRPRRLRKMDTQAGSCKSFRLPLRVRSVEKVVWFAVGNAKEIRYRLKRWIPSIGKKISIGYGRVARWEAESVEEDWSWFAPSPAGPVLMRVLPAGIAVPADLVGYRRWMGSPVSPYWSAENFCEVLMPC